MTQISRPWQGTTPGDAGPYSSDNWSQLQRYLLGDDAINGDSGPITGSGTAPDPGLTATQRGAGANMSVDVSLGAALVNGTFYYSDATVNLPIAANASGNPRIDTVVLNKDWSAQTIRLAIAQGTPAGTPVPPSMIQSPGVQWQVPLWDVAVANGAASITNANITPHKNPANVADGVYLQGVLNNTGAVLQTGDVVVIDTSADRAAKTTTTANDATVLGVWVGRTPIAGYGRVLVEGIGYVNSSAAVTRGQALATTNVAKQAAPETVGSSLYEFAIALQTTSGAGLVLCLLVPLTASNQYFATGRARSYVRTAGSYTTASAVASDVDGTNLAFTFTTKSTRVLVIFSGDYANTNVTNANFIGINLDGTDYEQEYVNAVINVPLGFCFALALVLSANASHTIKARFRTGAGTMTIYGTGANVSSMEIIEVG